MNKVLKLLVLSSLFSTTLAYTASSDDIKELTKARSSSKLQPTNSAKEEVDILNNPAANGAGSKQFNLNENDDETSKKALGEEDIIVD